MRPAAPSPPAPFALKPGTFITECMRNAHKLLIADCSHSTAGTVWIATSEYGVFALITADSMECAYDALIDEMPTIDAADVPEAYGLDSQAKLDALVAADNWPPLQEGYTQQSNCSGSGIVDKGHLHLRVMDQEDAGHMCPVIESY